MLFPTIDFAIFFAVVFTVNWLLNPYPAPWKLTMIGFSYVFYGWVGWSYCLLLLSTTVVAFTGGAAVNAIRNERGRRIAMGVAVALLLGILAWFKYYGFVSVNLDNLTHAVGLGHSTTYWVLLSMVWCAAIAIVFSTMAVLRFSRRR